MKEQYVGPKFRVHYARRAPPVHPDLARLCDWCHRWAALGLAGRAMGNLSFRSPAGFIITPSGTDPQTILPEQLVEVISTDSASGEVTVVGTAPPSSESFLHGALYLARPSVNAVFHGHSERLLAAAERLALPITRRAVPYGTAEVALEALAVLGEGDLVILRDHGFVALGETMDAAGRRVLEVLGRL